MRLSKAIYGKEVAFKYHQSPLASDQSINNFRMQKDPANWTLADVIMGSIRKDVNPITTNPEEHG